MVLKKFFCALLVFNWQKCPPQKTTAFKPHHQKNKNKTNKKTEHNTLLLMCLTD